MNYVFNEQQYKIWKEARKEINETIRHQKIKKAGAAVITKLHAEVFNHQPTRPCCPNKWIDAINSLEVCYEAYNEENNIDDSIDIIEYPVEELRIGDETFAIGKPRSGGEELIAGIERDNIVEEVKKSFPTLDELIAAGAAIEHDVTIPVTQSKLSDVTDLIKEPVSEETISSDEPVSKPLKSKNKADKKRSVQKRKK